MQIKIKSKEQMTEENGYNENDEVVKYAGQVVSICRVEDLDTDTPMFIHDNATNGHIGFICADIDRIEDSQLAKCGCYSILKRPSYFKNSSERSA